jgi:hypothetical protein
MDQDRAAQDADAAVSSLHTLNASKCGKHACALLA